MLKVMIKIWTTQILLASYSAHKVSSLVTAYVCVCLCGGGFCPFGVLLVLFCFVPSWLFVFLSRLLSGQDVEFGFIGY